METAKTVTLVDAEGVQPERRPDGTFATGVSGNPGGKKRHDPTTREIASLASRMSPGVLLKLRRMVDAADEAKPTTAAVKAAEIILRQAFGDPGTEAERLMLNIAQNDVRFSFSMTDTGAETLEGEAIEDADIGEPRALPPGDA